MESWREELYHHGIKGQRWGVRRYQNEDGTLTATGRKRQGNTSEKPNDITDKRKANLKKAIAIGAAAAAVGLAAYGAYKLNSKVKNNLIEESTRKGRAFISRAYTSQKRASDYMNLADRAKFLSDTKLSEAQSSYYRNQAEKERTTARQLIDFGSQHLKRAESGKYTTAEKAKMLARMISDNRR